MFIERTSKVHQKNAPYKRALKFDQWKQFSENYKPMIISLLLVYKITKYNCLSWLLFEFIQTQKSYPISLNKISIVTWRLLAEAVFQRCSVKEVFLEISQSSQENTCARVSFLIKLRARVSFLMKLPAWSLQLY